MVRQTPEALRESVYAGAETGRTGRGVTRRAVLLGLLLVCGEVTVISFSEPLIQSTPMNVSHFPVGFFMWFVAAVLFLNPALKRIHAGYALSPSEFLTIAAMGLLGALVPVSGLAGFFLGTLIAPFYFASPENRWAEVLHPHIPNWLAPTDVDALKVFFEGAPPGYDIPWRMWAVPLTWWFLFIGTLTFVLLCIAVMLRKQWVENERLVYPLISPVSDLIEGSEDRPLLPSIARNRLFWVGFGIGFGVMAWNALVFFWPTLLPRINYFGRDWFLIRNFPYLTTRFNMYTFGFGFFANVDVLFSVWVFYLLYWLQTGVLTRIGYDPGPGPGTVSAWECAGGLFAMVAWALWSARGHLREVVRTALRSARGTADSGELLSCRTALFGFAAGTVFALFWLHAAGMEYGVALFLLLAMYVTYLGLAKVVSESGLLYLAWSVGPQALVTGALGVQAIAPGSMTAMAFTEGLFFHGKGMFMSGFAQGAKMADLAGGNRRRMALGMGLALVVGVLLCFTIMLSWGYQNGAYNLHEYPFRFGRTVAFPTAATLIQNPEGTASSRLVFFGLGVVLMSLMTFLRYRLPWWPVHPIGFGIAVSVRIVKSVFSIFMVWACKVLILRIGGVALYRRFRPLFVGLLAGYSLGVGLSFLVDFIWFPGQGHWVHIY